MNHTLSIVIVDDHPVFRDGLRYIVEGDSTIAILGEAGSGPDGMALIQEKKPDVALLDIEMPGMTGLEVARQVQEQNLITKLVVLTMYHDEAIFNTAMDLGVYGYILKENASSDVLSCIKAVARGEYYISPTISGYLLNRSRKRETALRTAPALASLTPAEWRVLRLIAANKTSKQMSESLCISPKTVEHHRANIAEKLNLHGNNSLLRFALEHKDLL